MIWRKKWQICFSLKENREFNKVIGNNTPDNFAGSSQIQNNMISQKYYIISIYYIKWILKLRHDFFENCWQDWAENGPKFSSGLLLGP